MATPHIAGAMALLWSSHPELVNQINASRTALNNSALFISSTQCGTAGPPNNVYGWGRVDILAAVGSGGGDIALQARVKAQGNKHKVQLKWSPADGGNMKYCEMVPSSGQHRTMEKLRTISEPKREHSSIRSVKRTQAIARMKSPSRSRSRPIRLLEGS